jgi:hypothetical protein
MDDGRGVTLGMGKNVVWLVAARWGSVGIVAGVGPVLIYSRPWIIQVDDFALNFENQILYILACMETPYWAPRYHDPIWNATLCLTGRGWYSDS